MKFLSNKRWIEVEINIETASKEEIMEAYSSVNEWAGCGRGAFPGSKEWKKGMQYEQQADLLKSSRPECFN